MLVIKITDVQALNSTAWFFFLSFPSWNIHFTHSAFHLLSDSKKNTSEEKYSLFFIRWVADGDIGKIFICC